MKTILSYCALAVVFCSSMFGFEFNRTPAGLIKGARLKYTSSNTIQIGVGFGDTMGSYWEIVATDTLVTTGYTLTGLTTTANGVVHYIYIDRTNSSLPNVVIRNSTTAPIWSDDFMGWYDNADRCIGAVWVKADGTINPFLCPDDETYVFPIVGSSPNWIVLPAGSASTVTQVWSTRDITSYTAANIKEVTLQLACNNSSWTWVTAGLAEEFGNERYEDGIRSATALSQLRYERNASRKYRWMAAASSTSGSVLMQIVGYRIER